MSERPGIMTLQVIGITKRNLPSPLHEGFPGGASGKEPACQCRRQKRCGFHPCVGKSLCRRSWQPSHLQDSCLQDPTDRGASRATVHKVTRLKQLTHAALITVLAPCLAQACATLTQSNFRTFPFPLKEIRYPFTGTSLPPSPTTLHPRQSLIYFVLL